MYTSYNISFRVIVPDMTYENESRFSPVKKHGQSKNTSPRFYL